MAALCLLLYAAGRLVGLPEGFWSSYFNDILGGCLILAVANILLAAGGLRPLQALLPCLGLSLLCGLFWEFLTPLYLPRSVADPWDLAAYMTGAAVWWAVCRIKKCSL